MFERLRPYQIPHAEAAAGILARRNALLDASDTGTGKTYVAVALHKARGTVPVVVGPKSVLASWDRVAARLNHEVMGINYEKARGSRAKTGAKARLQKDGTIRKYALSDFGEEKAYGGGSFWRWKYDFEDAIFDEVHLCAGNTTLNSKMLIAAKRQFGAVTMLSATAASDPLDMKALGYVLGLHSLKDFRDFLYEHGCRPGWAGGWVFGDPDDPEVGKAHMAILHSRIFPEMGVRLCKRDIPGFPRSQISSRMVNCTEEMKADLEKVEGDLRTTGVAGNELKRIELALLPVVVDMAKQYEHAPQVFFVNYRASARELSKMLKGCPIIWGEQDIEERQEIIDAYQANKHPHLVATYPAGGPGINLQDPVDQVERTGWQFPTFDGVLLHQSTGRIWRDGGGLSQQFLVGLAGTYQEDVLDVVAGKLERMEALNEGDLLRG